MAPVHNSNSFSLPCLLLRVQNDFIPSDGIFILPHNANGGNLYLK